MFANPLAARLADCERVLLAGAGGGFDFVSAVPLALGLREAGTRVAIANLTFTRFEAIDPATAERLTDTCAVVTPDAEASSSYFPELHVSRWFAERGDPTAIYTIARSGVRQVRKAYAAIVEREQPDAIVLVDGGTDSLMRGDEAGLGTPAEDATSIAAVHWLDAPGVRERLLVCIGFGVDAYHGVCHAQFLEAVSALTTVGGYLGTFSLNREQPETQAYMECVAMLNQQMPLNPSIVCNSIRDSIRGHYGDHHATHRTHGSRLWINPLMGLVWCFDLPAVAAANLYLDEIRDSGNFIQTIDIIDNFRARITRKPFEAMPG